MWILLFFPFSLFLLKFYMKWVSKHVLDSSPLKVDHVHISNCFPIAKHFQHQSCPTHTLSYSSFLLSLSWHLILFLSVPSVSNHIKNLLKWCYLNFFSSTIFLCCISRIKGSASSIIPKGNMMLASNIFLFYERSNNLFCNFLYLKEY